MMAAVLFSMAPSIAKVPKAMGDGAVFAELWQKR